MSNLFGFMDYLRDIRAFHHAMVAPFTGKPQGCPWGQITALERRVGFPLPRAYAQFLRWMGRDRSGLFRGSSCFIRDVEANTRGLPKLLARTGVKFVLPARHLAFFSHQGYQMVWFPLPAVSDNPLCWAYCEGQTLEPEQVGSFTDWLRTWVTDSAAFMARVRPERE